MKPTLLRCFTYNFLSLDELECEYFDVRPLRAISPHIFYCSSADVSLCLCVCAHVDVWEHVCEYVCEHVREYVCLSKYAVSVQTPAYRHAPDLKT